MSRVIVFLEFQRGISEKYIYSPKDRQDPAREQEEEDIYFTLISYSQGVQTKRKLAWIDYKNIRYGPKKAG